LHSFQVVVIAIESPLKIGIYKNYQFIKEITSDKKTSDILPVLFKEILNTYDIDELFYVRGPGSFMAIKIAYVFLKTICIAKNIKLYGVDGFYFNNSSPIKSIGKNFFFKENKKIVIKKQENIKPSPYQLPKILNKNDFIENATPLYVLPAV